MGKAGKETEQIEITDVQELQLETGLSENLCKKILDPDSVYNILEMQSIVNVLEKFPISLTMPIIKYMFSNVLGLIYLHKVEDFNKNIS